MSLFYPIPRRIGYWVVSMKAGDVVRYFDGQYVYHIKRGERTGYNPMGYIWKQFLCE